MKSQPPAWTFADPAFDDIPDELRCGLDVDAALRISRQCEETFRGDAELLVGQAEHPHADDGAVKPVGNGGPGPIFSIEKDRDICVHAIVMQLSWHGQERATMWVLEFPPSGRKFNMKKFRPTTTVASAIAGTIAVLAVASPAKADWNNHHWRYYSYGPWWGWGTPAYYYQPPVVYVPPPVYYAPAPPVYYSPGVSLGVTIR